MRTPNRSVAFGHLLAAAVTILLLLFAPPGAHSQSADESQQVLLQEQLEQLVAPIALHPDSLLSQIMMASTYPLEVVQAARWVKANPKVTGDALEKAMQKQPWDPNVKSIAAFPQVLQMMNDELAWTQQLGDAFLAQKEDLLEAVQKLRAKADKAGNLKTTKQQTVKKQTISVDENAATSAPIAAIADRLVARAQALLTNLGYDPGPVDGLMGPATRNAIAAFERERGLPETGLATQDVIDLMEAAVVERGGERTVIVIEPADPEVIYVPVYNPTVIYGTWPYSAYPPYYWYPPGYVARRAVWFGVGYAAGRALWGDVHWGRNEVNINVNRYNNFNKTNINNGNWQHNPGHRKGVPYKNSNVSDRYRKGTGNVKAREQYRGRADAGRRDLASRSGSAQRPAAGQRPGAGKPPSKGKRPSAAKRPATPKARAAPRSSASKRPAAYQGTGNGKQVRQHSSRGKASRTSSRSRPASSYSRPTKSRGGSGRGGSRGGGRRR